MSDTACVLKGYYPLPRLAWCGREIPTIEWCFVDATHALLHVEQSGAILMCPACAEAISKVVSKSLS